MNIDIPQRNGSGSNSPSTPTRLKVAFIPQVTPENPTTSLSPSMRLRESTTAASSSAINIPKIDTSAEHFKEMTSKEALRKIQEAPLDKLRLVRISSTSTIEDTNRMSHSEEDKMLQLLMKDPSASTETVKSKQDVDNLLEEVLDDTNTKEPKIKRNKKKESADSYRNIWKSIQKGLSLIDTIERSSSAASSIPARPPSSASQDNQVPHYVPHAPSFRSYTTPRSLSARNQGPIKFSSQESQQQSTTQQPAAAAATAAVGNVLLGKSATFEHVMEEAGLDPGLKFNYQAAKQMQSRNQEQRHIMNALHSSGAFPSRGVSPERKYREREKVIIERPHIPELDIQRLRSTKSEKKSPSKKSLRSTARTQKTDASENTTFFMTEEVAKNSTDESDDDNADDMTPKEISERRKQVEADRLREEKQRLKLLKQQKAEQDAFEKKSNVQAQKHEHNKRRLGSSGGRVGTAQTISAATQNLNSMYSAAQDKFQQLQQQDDNEYEPLRYPSSAVRRDEDPSRSESVTSNTESIQQYRKLIQSILSEEAQKEAEFLFESIRDSNPSTAQATITSLLSLTDSSNSNPAHRTAPQSASVSKPSTSGTFMTTTIGSTIATGKMTQSDLKSQFGDLYKEEPDLDPKNQKPRFILYQDYEEQVMKNYEKEVNENKKRKAELNLILQVQEVQRYEENKSKVRQLKEAQEEAKIKLQKQKYEKEEALRQAKEDEATKLNKQRLKRIAKEQKMKEKVQQFKSTSNAVASQKTVTQRFTKDFNCQHQMISKQMLKKELQTRKDEELQEKQMLVRQLKDMSDQRKTQLESLWFQDLNRKRALATFGNIVMKKKLEQKKQTIEQEMKKRHDDTILTFKTNSSLFGKTLKANTEAETTQGAQQAPEKKEEPAPAKTATTYSGLRGYDVDAKYGSFKKVILTLPTIENSSSVVLVASTSPYPPPRPVSSSPPGRMTPRNNTTKTPRQQSPPSKTLQLEHRPISSISNAISATANTNTLKPQRAETPLLDRSHPNHKEDSKDGTILIVTGGIQDKQTKIYKKKKSRIHEKLDELEHKAEEKKLSNPNDYYYHYYQNLQNYKNSMLNSTINSGGVPPATNASNTVLSSTLQSLQSTHNVFLPMTQQLLQQRQEHLKNTAASSAATATNSSSVNVNTSTSTIPAAANNNSSLNGSSFINGYLAQQLANQSVYSSDPNRNKTPPRDLRSSKSFEPMISPVDTSAQTPINDFG